MDTGSQQTQGTLSERLTEAQALLRDLNGWQPHFSGSVSVKCAQSVCDIRDQLVSYLARMPAADCSREAQTIVALNAAIKRMQ